MSTEKVDLGSREALLFTAYLAVAFIFLSDFLLPETLLGFRAMAGLYLYFYPLGALTLKGLRIAPENVMEKLALSAFTSISLIALSQLCLHLAFNIPFTFHTLLIVIAVWAIVLYALGGWKKA